MKHIIALILKFVMVAVVLEIMLSLLTNQTIGQILVVSIAVTLVSYLLGDVLILAFSNNTGATLSDVILAFVTIYLFNYWSNYPRVSTLAAALCALVLAGGEIFFHRYMFKTVYPNRVRRRGV